MFSFWPQTRRQFSSSLKLKQPATSKPDSPSSSSRPPSRIPSKPALTPRLSSPGRLLNRTRFPLVRDVSKLDAGPELMVSSLSENDRQEEMRKRDLRADGQRLKQQVSQLNIQVSQLGDEINALDSGLPELMPSVRLHARVEYKLRSHNRVDHGLESSASEVFGRATQLAIYYAEDVLDRVESQIWDIRKKWTLLYQEKRMAPLEVRLDTIEADIDICYDLIDEYRSIRPRYDAHIYREALSLRKEIMKIKERGGEHDAHRELVDQLRRSSIELATILQESHLKRIESELIQSNGWIPIHGVKGVSSVSNNPTTNIRPAYFKIVADKTACILFKIHQIGVELGSREIATYEAEFNTHEDISRLGHELRDIELHMRMAQHLPQATLVDRQILSVAAAYVWPWYHDLTGLWNLSHQLVDDCKYLVVPGVRTLGKEKRMRLLGRSAIDFARKVRKLLREFERMLKDGDIPIARHSLEILRRDQKRLIYLYDMQNRHWDSCLLSCREVIKLISGGLDIAYRREWTLEQSRRRSFLVQKLESTLHDIHITFNKGARASYKSLRQLVMIWNEARMLSQGGNRPGTIQHHNDISDSPEVSSCTDCSSNDETVSAIRSNLWLQTQSLYPLSDSVIINFVSSCYTLQQVILELLEEQVIGLDFIETGDSKPPNSRFDYVVLATEKHVYIVDTMSIALEDPIFVRNFLVKLMDDASVLKVMINSHQIAAELWDCYLVNATSLYDVAQHKLTSNSNETGILSNLVEQHFVAAPILSDVKPSTLYRTRRRAPLKFFNYLAVRAYALLRLFYVFNKSDTVHTTDRHKTFDISMARRNAYDRQGGKVVDPQLGPVCIDAAKSASALRRYFPRRIMLRPGTIIDNRKAWMEEMSTRMARNLLKSANRQSPALRKYKKQDHRTHGRVVDSIAAFYLATTFCQNLGTIANYLGLQNPAQWILWAAYASKAYGFELHLHVADEEKFKSAAGHFDVDIETMFDKLTRTTAHKGQIPRSWRQLDFLHIGNSSHRSHRADGVTHERDVWPTHTQNLSKPIKSAKATRSPRRKRFSGFLSLKSKENKATRPLDDKARSKIHRVSDSGLSGKGNLSSHKRRLRKVSGKSTS